MKSTKRIALIFCLLAGLTSTQLFGQSPNKAYQWFDSGEFFTDVFCDGEAVDYVEGFLEFHRVVLWKEGRVFDIIQAKGHGESMYTGEIFKYKEVDKISWGDGMYKWTYHLKGNMGSKYMGHIVWNMNTGELTAGPTSCN